MRFVFLRIVKKVRLVRKSILELWNKKPHYLFFNSMVETSFIEISSMITVKNMIYLIIITVLWGYISSTTCKSTLRCSLYLFRQWVNSLKFCNPTSPMLQYYIISLKLSLKKVKNVKTHLFLHRGLIQQHLKGEKKTFFLYTVFGSLTFLFI